MKHVGIPKEDFDDSADGRWLKGAGYDFNRLLCDGSHQLSAISRQPAFRRLRSLHLQNWLSMFAAAQHDDLFSWIHDKEAEEQDWREDDRDRDNQHESHDNSP